MPRSPRRDLPEGIYHVTSRGVAGERIFVDDVDREEFVALLRRVAELWGWAILAWCLMGTHYHLVVDAPLERVSRGMHRLNGLYAQRFNKRYGRRGHLFEARFAAWVIRDEHHLRSAIAYILENPLRAGLCVDPDDWMWCGTRLPAGTVPGTWPIETVAGQRR